MKPKALSARPESFRDVLYICITTIRFIDGCYHQELDPRARGRNTRLDFSRVMDRSLRAVAGPDFVLQNSCADRRLRVLPSGSVVCFIVHRAVPERMLSSV